MPQTVELPDDLADALTDEASRLGLSLPDYAVRLLASNCPPPGFLFVAAQTSSRSGSLKGWSAADPTSWIASRKLAVSATRPSVAGPDGHARPRYRHPDRRAARAHGRAELVWWALGSAIGAWAGVMELIQGARDGKQVREALRLTAPLQVIWPTVGDCQRALADFTAFHLSHGLGLLDALIAAIAVGLSAEL